MKQKTRELTNLDILILLLMFFGEPIYSSTQAYFFLLETNQVQLSEIEIYGAHDLTDVVYELLTLLMVFIYLALRGFDFKAFDFSINKWSFTKILIYISLASFVACMVEFVLVNLFPGLYTIFGAPSKNSEILGELNFSLIILSLINGFYEEIFFMGLVFCVKRNLPFALTISLLARFAFHTYQGLAGAIVISSLGLVFVVLRFKYKDLIPFILAHSFFDVFGLTWIGYLLDY